MPPTAGRRTYLRILCIYGSFFFLAKLPIILKKKRETQTRQNNIANNNLSKRVRSHYRKPAICRVPRLCRVYFIGHSAKTVFAECQKNTLGKQKHTAKYVFAECFFLALGKEAFCRVHFFCPRQIIFSKQFLRP